MPEPATNHAAKVDRQSRITLPKWWVKAQGLSAEDAVDLRDVEYRRAGWTRRTVLRYVSLGVGAAAVGFVADVLGISKLWQDYREKRHRAHFELLQELFGVGAVPSASLMPARDHPFRRLQANDPPYEIEADCCRAYRDAFFAHVPLRSVSDYRKVRSEDTLVLFGSQVSNQIAREILGNPFRQRANSAGTVGTRVNRVMVPLRWSLYSPPDAPIRVRRQYGLSWRTRDHALYDLANRKEILSPQDLTTDYLLVTALPRFASGSQRCLIFGGLHGPGTRATVQLLLDPPVNELSRLENIVRGEPYYQALFEVAVGEDERRELVPKNMHLIDAVVLAPESA